jgi:rod shape-determining protein MreD
MLYLLFFAPLVLLLVAIQATVLNQMTLAGGHLDIIVISLVMLTLYGRYELALLAGVLMAPFIDALSGMPLGVSVLPLLSVIFLAHGGGKNMFGARLGWPVIIIFISSLLAGLITLAELALLGWQMPWTDLMLRVLAPTALLNGMAAIAIYLPIIIFGERRGLH